MRTCHEIEGAMQKLFFQYMLNGGKARQRMNSAIFPLHSDSTGELTIQRRNNHDPRSGKFFGLIQIWYKGGLAWFCSYTGQYEPDALSVVHQIVLEQYQQGEFTGGRGPREIRRGDYRYLNTPDLNWRSFSEFSGNERVLRVVNLPQGESPLRGTLQYMGRSLLPEGELI